MKKILVLLLLAAFFAMPAEAAYESYVETAIADGVISGDENGDVHAERQVSRGEFAVILSRFLNLSGGFNSFLDVSSDDWFHDAIVAANHYSILMGDENGYAKPYDPIRREDAITVLGRFYGATSKDISLAPDCSDYAKEYWAYAVSNKLLTQTDPNEFLSKGEILQLLYDYDTKDGTMVRFMAGYPRISQTDGLFGRVSIDIHTNKPCTIYYAITPKDTPHKEVNNFLCQTNGKIVTASIPANMNNIYDLYLVAVDSHGMTSKISIIPNTRSFAFASGHGTKNSPYIIYSRHQLEQITLLPEKFFRLGNDIIIDGDWSPLPEFSGTLDGNGHVIKGIKISEKRGAGLFSLVTGTVRNLTVSADVSATKNAGIIAGENDGLIEGCSTMGTIEVNTDNAGGICGTNYGTVKNCLTSLYSVASGSFAGGICGANYGVIENCLAATNVVASDMYAGGICGTNYGGTLKNNVSACLTVYDVLTQNSGRITTNKKGGKLENNYFYEDAIVEDTLYEPGYNSQNGLNMTFEQMIDMDFYQSLGYSTKNWKTAKNGFRLIYPNLTKAPELIPGETIYFPIALKTAQDLRNIDLNPAAHYILSDDIYVSTPWKTICDMAGFSGTLDGDGHTIYNLNLNTQSGFFSNITGGTVKNLTFRHATSSSDTIGGIIAACNYGYIENCSVYGTIQSRKSGHIGGITGLNHGLIANTTSYVEIINKYSNSTVGGICAENDGVISACTYRGKITINGDNSVVGGICGYDISGYINDCFAYINTSCAVKSGYIGGICGMADGSQIYKCVSGGNIISNAGTTLYSGGICALAQNATLYNCYSLAEIHSFSETGYAGGICGCSSGSNIQNTYAAGSLLSGNNISTGGICGYSENGFIMQNVALNPAINGGKNIGAIFGDANLSGIFDNFSCDRTLINSQHIISNQKNGTIKSFDALKNTEFFFKPVSSGGLLSWPNATLGDDVWEESDTGYSFPVLSGINTLGLLSMPAYK